MGEETVMTKPVSLPFFLLSLPVPHFILFYLCLLVALSFSFSHCMQHKMTIFVLFFFKMKEKHPGDVQARLAVKSL